jgi:transcriptional regulator with XRE-family HTH domain
MRRLNIVGPQVRKMRMAQGWSQRQLAIRLQLEGLDVSRSGVAKIESRLVCVEDYELSYLAKVFGVGFESLFPKIDYQEPLNETVETLTRK